MRVVRRRPRFLNCEHDDWLVPIPTAGRAPPGWQLRVARADAGNPRCARVPRHCVAWCAHKREAVTGVGIMQLAMSTVGGFGEDRVAYRALVLMTAVLTLLFGIGGSVLALLRGSQLGRILVTICCVFYLGNGIITLALGNIGSVLQLVVAIPLAVLWWVPPTSRGMQARRAKKATPQPSPAM